MGLPIAEQNHPLVIVAIDDDPGILGFYRAIMSGMGVRFESSTDPWQTLDLVAAHDPSLVILDLTMPGIDGMELLHRIKSRDPQTRVVMITGTYTIETAVKAIQKGAIDYVCKPVTAQKLREIVTRVQSLVAQEERTRALERELADASNLEGILGRSPAMLEVVDLVQRVAPHFRTAVIIGERGSGRKTVARGLHNLSPGRAQRFVIFKSEDPPEKLPETQPSHSQSVGPANAVVSESELFGSAIAGTVFLDEIGDLSAAMQHRLLRLLEQVAAKELDESLTPQEGLRIIGSTSRDLSKETQSGQFRSDLWYRLSMVQVHLPPLRERADDILLLARHFLAQYSAHYGKSVRRMSLGAEAALLAHSWPGNVTDLENVIGRACMLTEGNVLDCGALPAGVVLPVYGDEILLSAGGLSTSAAQGLSTNETLRQKVRDFLDHEPH